MKSKIGTSGYLEVDLRSNGRHKYCRIHRLVAQAFISNPTNLKIVNHKDENKTNNYVQNLEWCTAKYNMNYGTARARMIVKITKQVAQINRNSNEVISVFASVTEAERKTGINQGQISRVCRGERKTTGGYKWRYADDKNNSSQ